jgi:beta-glucosidase
MQRISKSTAQFPLEMGMQTIPGLISSVRFYMRTFLLNVNDVKLPALLSSASVRTMIRLRPLAGLGLLVLMLQCRAHAQDFAAQAEQLLSQMTLTEKVGQMTQADMDALKDHPDDVQTYFLGSVLSGGNSDPADNSPRTWLQAVEHFKASARQTRLKIPLLYGIDAVHGHNNVDGAVIFPHNIGLGATHNPRLVEQAARAAAEEVAGTGINWAFAPCLAVPQNDRWGRTYEGFSDDPKLVSELGDAAIAGWQGKNLSEHGSVLACAKHFLADGGTLDGIDQGNTVCDEATLRKLFLPPYAAAVKAGVGSVMVSYSSWNGKKMHGNRQLVTEVLKGELGFKGLVVSDWAAIDQLGSNYKADVETAINAGLDMIMIPSGRGKANNYVDFINALVELVNEGKVSPQRIDDAVRRILTVKFQMGLFENRPADPVFTASIGSADHRRVARECVRQSLVLLKNENNVLPLSKKLKRIVVVGKAAEDLGMQCGGWTISWQGAPGEVTHGGTTILKALRATAPAGSEVVFSPTGNDVAGADVAVVVVGELPYAEMQGDTRNLSLQAVDVELIARVKAAKVPVVTVLLSGRPLILGSALDTTDALVAAWLPGTEGQGVADVLYGAYNPTGKLPRNWLRSNDQLMGSPTVASRPLFPRGFGLTYQNKPLAQD